MQIFLDCTGGFWLASAILVVRQTEGVRASVAPGHPARVADAMAKQLDFIVVGAGVVGAAIARNLVGRLGRTGSVALLDKSHSASIPEHASGRNSGVLHAGFYYTADSLKAKLTRAGNVFLHDYCGEKGIAINKCVTQFLLVGCGFEDHI